jgi:hypothetical protein
MDGFFFDYSTIFSSLIASVLQHRIVERIDMNYELERIWKETVGLFHSSISAFCPERSKPQNTSARRADLRTDIRRPDR